MLMVIVLLLSMSAPGIPGSGLFCFAVLNAQIGIPLEAMVICTCIEILSDPFDTAMNVIGDMTGSLIAASSEKLIDKKVYNR